jgi:hypothetical protein
MDGKSCNKPISYIKFDRWEYAVLKNFAILISATKKLITKYNYAVFEGKLITCITECAEFTFTIKYEDEYRVWNNFSMMYQGRMYYYDEYRITDELMVYKFVILLIVSLKKSGVISLFRKDNVSFQTL